MKEDYAFIEFASTNSAARALSELNGARVAGSKILVEEAKPKEGAIDTSSKNKSELTSIFLLIIVFKSYFNI
jgi:RNA recognition motif-containing protein